MNDIVYLGLGIGVAYFLIGMVFMGVHLRWTENNDPVTFEKINDDPMEALKYTLYMVLGWLPITVSYLRTVLWGEKPEDEE